MRSFLIFCVYVSYSLANPVFASGHMDLGSVQIKKSFQNSLRYEKVENYHDAIRALLPVMQANPQIYAGHLRLGWLYYLQGKYANSIAHYEMAIRKSSAAVEPKIGILLPLLAQGNFLKVEQQAYKILTVDYYNYYANLRLSVALRKQGKNDLALKIISRMLKLYPADVEFLSQKGLVFQQQGRHSYADRTFSQVLSLDSENEIAKQFYLAQKRAGTTPIQR